MDFDTSVRLKKLKKKKKNRPMRSGASEGQLLNTSYKENVTKEDVRRKIQAVTGKYEELLILVKNRNCVSLAASQVLLA